MPDIAQIQVNFNDKAQTILIALYEKFKVSSKQSGRTKDNSVCQQQEGKYLATLKYQLESPTIEYLNKNKTLVNISQLNKKLTDPVNDYLTEFKQKSRSL